MISDPRGPGKPPRAGSPRPARPAAGSPRDLADRLHAAAIHLLRRLRTEDDASGLTAPQLSTLSVLVFGGPSTLTRLARVEQVRPPTMTRLLHGLEREGLVERVADPEDRRRKWVRATPRGQALLEQGRARRVARLTADIGGLRPADRRRLLAAAPILEQLSRPAGPSPEEPRRTKRGATR